MIPRTEHSSASVRHSGRLRQLRRRLLLPLALLGGAVVLGGCQLPTFGGFKGATVQGHDEYLLWSGTVIAGLSVAVIVWGLIFWSIARYRRKNDAIPKQFQNHIPIEITYTAIPVVIVAVLFYFTVITENAIDAVAKRPAQIVHVLAYRWGWQFSYYNGQGQSEKVLIRTPNDPPTQSPEPYTSSAYPQMVLPNDSTVRIVLNSRDVVHGFYVPAFNFSRYAQPGYANVFDFSTRQTGDFRGQCTQYCGLYHAEMIFSVKVVSPSKFQSWLSHEQAAQAGSGAAT